MYLVWLLFSTVALMTFLLVVYSAVYTFCRKITDVMLCSDPVAAANAAFVISANLLCHVGDVSKPMFDVLSLS